jgi:small conductance mechanosensitive channel
VTLRFIVEVPEDKIYSGARILNHDLLLGFRRLGVECPFPQLDVHQQ